VLDAWLARRGNVVAATLDSSHESICDRVSARLAAQFPTLCYDAGRPDAYAFQQHTFHETPRRFHRLLQVLLQFQALEVIEREYRWGWPILQRYGVDQRHLLAQVQFYFEAVRDVAPLDGDDQEPLAELEAAILQVVEQVTRLSRLDHNNGHRSLNGFHPRGF